MAKQIKFGEDARRALEKGRADTKSCLQRPGALLQYQLE